VAEWSCSGLQSRVRRFDSDPSLQIPSQVPGCSVHRSRVLRAEIMSLYIPLAGAVVMSVVLSADASSGKLYEVTTETGMPHLEENLRYATTRERRCLTLQDLPRAFPALEHPALVGCRLEERTRDRDIVSYALACAGESRTTGEATWHIQEHQLRGSIHVKLGGKNMTFFQRVTARSLGACRREFESKSRSSRSAGPAYSEPTL
jgi:hypothetical protein